MHNGQRRIAGLVLAGVLLGARTEAQTATESFGELQRHVRADDTIVVADHNGREVKGKLFDLSDGSLTLLTPGRTTGQRRYLPEDIIRITRQDSVRNGAAIGAGVAVGGFVGIAVLSGRLPMIGCGAREPGASILACLGLIAVGGAATGALVDSSMSRTVYSRRVGRTALKISPALNPDRAGFRLSLAF